MNEKLPQLNQEKNLALERQDSVKLHNELLAENNSFSEKEKEWDIEKKHL